MVNKYVVIYQSWKFTNTF